MTPFISLSTVLARIQINDDLEGVTEVIASALNGAQIFIESVLGCRLTLAQYDCLYFLDGDAFSGLQPGGFFKLELPAYFLRNSGSQPILMQVGSKWQEVTLAVPTTDYRVNLVTGQILLDAQIYANKYIKVACWAGFDPDAVLVPADALLGTPEERGSEALPDWLVEAIIGYVGTVLDSSQTAKKNTSSDSQFKRAAEQALAIMKSHLRSKGFVFRPLS